jgi:hypothetical protein
MLTHGVDNSALLLTLLNISFLAISEVDNKSQLRDKEFSTILKKINLQAQTTLTPEMKKHVDHKI